MGSDSRSASATSSKPRPKWRDRHLKQLDSDQLAEVQAHRKDDGSEFVSYAQLPQQQAGPEHDFANNAASNARQTDSRDERTAPARQPTRQRMYDDERNRNHRQHARNDREPENYTQRRRVDDRGERRSRTNTKPDAQVGNRRIQRKEHIEPGKVSADRDASDVSTTAPEVEKKRGFARLTGFRVSGPVKYGLMALAIVALLALSFLKPIDHSSQSQLDSALTRAMIGFGLARTLNGVISVAQGTEFAVQPAGVGVNFSPGEILDPINDLVERFSWVMLLATSSLGVQKILLEVSSWMGVSLLLGGAALFFLLTRMRNSALASLADIAGKILLLMLLVRFLIPLGSLANDWVYKQFLEPRFEESSQQLEIASDRIREISTRQAQTETPSESLTDRAKNFYNSMTAKFDFDGMLEDYRKSAENVSEHAVNLIVVFVLQTVLFPLLFLYLIYRLFKSVIRPARG